MCILFSDSPAILTSVGMAVRVLIEALLRGPTVSTDKSGNSSGGDGKGGGAREWIKQIKSCITIIR